jgi:hypothetical protein
MSRKRAIVVGAAFLFSMVLALLFWDNVVATEADTATFWTKTCGIELPEYRGGRLLPMAHLEPKDTNWYRFHLLYEHEAHYYKVKADRVEARASIVSDLLKRPITSSKSEECQWGSQACENVLQFKNSARTRCLTRLNENHGDVVLFLRNISNDRWRID